MKKFMAMPAAMAMVLALIMVRPVLAQQEEQQLPPPRIGMVTGAASFWRTGAQDWSPAQVNTPLAEGDTVYTAVGATLELQIGGRAYLRLAQNAMLTLLNDDQNLQQYKLTSGIAAFDLRDLPAGNQAGRHIEIDTPTGAFEINSSGYYRVEIADNATRFIVRRSGEATVTLADGRSRFIAPSQEVVVESGDGQGDIDTYVAPENDTWDQWNYARTDDLIDAISNRYVSSDVYGSDDLDHYGDWRVTPDYGAIWVPRGMAGDWAPYSSGSWVWDPAYSWTWVDTAPWGWAPYHYGRWVNVGGRWAWAPGPRQHRVAYAPALVAFFNGGTAVRVGVDAPRPAAVSWVALGWGEPCVPWWGHRGFAGRPWWGGWGGPRRVNDHLVQRNTVINNITINNVTYRNLHERNALIAVPEGNFGRGRLVGVTRPQALRVNELAPISGQHPVRPEASSLSPRFARTAVPANDILNRRAVGLHTPPQRPLPWQSGRENAMRHRQMPQAAVTPQQGQQAPQASQAVPASPQNQIIPVRPQGGQPGRQSPSWGRFGNAVGPERNEPRRAPEPPRIETNAGRGARMAPFNAAPANPVQAMPAPVPPVPPVGASAPIAPNTQSMRPDYTRPRNDMQLDMPRPAGQEPRQWPGRKWPQQSAPQQQIQQTPSPNVGNPSSQPQFDQRQQMQQRQERMEQRRDAIEQRRDVQRNSAPVMPAPIPPHSAPIIPRDAPPSVQSPAQLPAAPQMPQQQMRPPPQREEFHRNPAPAGQAPMQQRDMRQEHREPMREMRRPEASDALPGRPANRMYQPPMRPDH